MFEGTQRTTHEPCSLTMLEKLIRLLANDFSDLADNAVIHY